MERRGSTMRNRESFEYDVCLSFAGEDREYVRAVAKVLKERGIKVFFDEWEEATLWGKDLYAHLDHIYQQAARYCILFISKNYAQRVWTNHERQSAQARAISQNSEYILPARFDSTEIPGLRRTVAYIDLRERNPAQFAATILRKLNSDGKREKYSPDPALSNEIETSIHRQRESMTVPAVVILISAISFTAALIYDNNLWPKIINFLNKKNTDIATTPSNSTHASRVTQPVIGVEVRSRAFSSEFLKKNNLPNLSGAVELDDLVPGGPADRAGLRRGDLLRKINGALFNGNTEFVNKVRSSTIGQPIILEVWRESLPIDVPVVPIDSYDLYLQRCTSRDTTGCRWLAQLLREREPKDLPRALTLLQRACSAKDAASCADIGDMYNNKEGVPQDFKKASHFYDLSCQLGENRGCYSFGYIILENDSSSETERRQALTILQKACEGGIAISCTKLGDSVMQEDKIDTQNITEAKRLFELACNLGDASGCGALGGIYANEFAIGQFADFSIVFTFYEDACNGGHSKSCETMGNMLYEGMIGKREVTKDRSRSVNLFQNGCLGGQAYSCYSAGWQYLRADGVKEDRAKSAYFLKLGCDAEHILSCAELGHLYLTTSPIGNNPDFLRLSRIYSEKACAKNNAQGCTSLGTLYAFGWGVSEDKEKARVLYSTSCDAGYAPACSNLGQLYLRDYNTIKAREMLQKACLLGDTESCVNVKNLDNLDNHQDKNWLEEIKDWLNKNS